MSWYKKPHQHPAAEEIEGNQTMLPARKVEIRLPWSPRCHLFHGSHIANSAKVGITGDDITCPTRHHQPKQAHSGCRLSWTVSPASISKDEQEGCKGDVDSCLLRAPEVPVVADLSSQPLPLELGADGIREGRSMVLPSQDVAPPHLLGG